MDCLVNYAWPGNVRELENLVQHMVVLKGGKTIGLSDLPPKFTSDFTPSGASDSPADMPPVDLGEGGIDFNDLVGRFEEQLIRQALSATSGNKKAAARLLNLKRTTLTEKIKKRNIDSGVG